ncbi:PaaI family thioesterase [Methylovirgula sp. 4M-Z18]|nr:PaaI family thioesterase [Methylovirgula sp. 4M-Z18]
MPTVPAGATNSRLVTWTTPQVDLRVIGAASGLDYLLGLLKSGALPPISELMNFSAVTFEHGRAVFEGTPAEFHYNPIGAVHGGFAATLLDSALGCAVHTTLRPGFAYTTVELKVNFVRPLRADTGPVTCEGKVIHVGGRIATADAKLSDASGRLYAHGTTTCLIFPVGEKA